MRAGTRRYSAYAPLLNNRSSQRFGWPRLQKKHSSQGAEFARNNSLPNAKLRHTFADRDDVPGHLVAEERRRLNHLRVIAAEEHLHIRAACQCSAYPDQDLTGANDGTGTDSSRTSSLPYSTAACMVVLDKAGGDGIMSRRRSCGLLRVNHYFQ